MSKKEAYEPGASQLIRLDRVLEITSLSRSSVYRLMQSDRSFPQPIKVGLSQARNAAIRFLLADVQSWVDKKAHEAGRA